MTRILHLIRMTGLSVTVLFTLLSAEVVARPPGVEPEAEKLLQAATRFLAAQQQFSVSTRNTLEAVLVSGQKLQFDHAAALSVRRPDRLRAERRGDLVDQVFYYGGKSLTLHNPADNYYATLPAPGTLEKMLDFARESLDIVAPAGDLIYNDAFQILMQDVTSGFVVGKSVVEGERCDHLAFRAPHVDWQIWIKEGDEPLPIKLVITTTDVQGAPQFTAVMTGWDLSPDLKEADFEFIPPKGAHEIEFLPLGEGSVGAR